MVSARSGSVSWRPDRFTLTARCSSAGRSAVPPLDLAAGLRQHPGADGDDQAGLLGHVEEGGRGQQAPGGVLPAQQGLHADPAAGGRLHDGLVEDDELVALEGAGQSGLGVDPLAGHGPGGLVEELDPALAAAGLGQVHGVVGVAEQLFGAGAVVVDEGHADAHADVEPLAVDQAKGSSMAVMARSARAMTASWLAMPSHRMTNSSPPKRDSVSVRPHDRCGAGRPRRRAARRRPRGPGCRSPA